MDLFPPPGKMDFTVECGLALLLTVGLTLVSTQFVLHITLLLLLGFLLIIFGAIDVFDIPWWVWVGLVLYFAIRGHVESYTPGSMIQAAKLGNARLIEKLLKFEHGRYALELDEKGYSPLMRAAERGSFEVVQILLETGLYDAHNINTKSKSGKSALWLAAQGNHEEVVRLLLKHGADPAGFERTPWYNRYLNFMTSNNNASSSGADANMRRRHRPANSLSIPPNYQQQQRPSAQATATTAGGGRRPSTSTTQQPQPQRPTPPPVAMPVAVPVSAAHPSAPVASSPARRTSSGGASEAYYVDDVPPLPGGWEERETEDGYTYYVDNQTKTTTWDRPAPPLVGAHF